jgi:hypothetical protein
MPISSERGGQESLSVARRKTILHRAVHIIVPLLFFSACISSAQTSERHLGVLCTISIKPATIQPRARNKLDVSLTNPLKTELTVTAFVVHLSPDISIGSPDLTFDAPVDLEAGGPLYAKQGRRRGSPYYPSLEVRITGGQEKRFSIDLSSLLWARMIDETPSSRRLESIEASGAYQISARVTVKGYKHEMTSNRVPVKWLEETNRGLQPQ